MMDAPVDTILVIGACLVVFFTGYLVFRWRRWKRAGRFAQAARKFRNKVLAELEGLYPVPRRWNDDAYPKFRETIPGVETAAAEFRKHMPSEMRGAFDVALRNYCKQCREITWQSCATFNIVPEISNPDDIGPKEIFRQNVNALLSFAKEA